MRPLLVLIALLLTAGIAGAADEVIIRSAVNPDEAWLGQRILLQIDVLGADGWAQIADFGELEIPGTYILRTESQGIRLSETIAGTSYSGQRYQVSLFCQRPGRVEVPPIPVTVVVKQWGVAGDETPRQMVTPAVEFVCTVPPGAEATRGLISTTELDASQTWSAEPDTVSLGDAITRTVTLEAVDVSAMAFPPLRHDEINGVGIYPGEPAVSDTTDRGALSGQRVETVTYVLEQPGQVELPTITLTWWDIGEEQLRRIELPGRSMVVAGAPPADLAEQSVSPVPSNPRQRIAIAVVALLALAFLVRLAPRAVQWLEARLRARRASEAAYFRGVESALHTGDATTILASVMRWLDRLDLETQPARLADFLGHYGDDEARAAMNEIAGSLASGNPVEQPAQLRRVLRSARKRYRDSRRQARAADQVLPGLNGSRTT